MNALVRTGHQIPAGVDPRAIDQRSGKPKVVSEKIRKAIKLLLDGNCKTATAAAERVGLTNERLSRAFREPHVAAFIREQTRASLAAGTLRATARILELIDSKSDHVSLEASERVLAIDGIMPPENRPNIQINNNIVPGYVICLKHVEEDDVPAAPQTIEHE